MFALMRRDMIKGTVRDFASLWHRTLIWNSIVLYKQHAVQHQEPSSFIALPHPPPPTMCTKDVPLRNDVPVHDFAICAPVAYTRGGARGTHRFLAESQSSPSRSTPHAPAHEERRVLEECETSPGLSRSG
jgi:hypothetical protein